MAALLNMFGVRAKRSLQQGLTAIRGTKICSSLYHTSLHPFEQFGPGLLVSTVDNFQLDRNKSCLCASVLPRGVKNALKTEALVTRGLTIGEQASCLEEPKASHSHVDYLSFTDKKLLAQCILDTYRASGAGGQHRNKTDSAVRLKHTPTGLVGQAADDRSQHVNKALALNRLRQVIAINVRRPVDLDNYEPPLQLLKILPAASTIKRDRGIGQQVGPKNSSYLQGLQALLDLLGAVKGSVSEAAPRLGLSTGMLSKLITADKVLWQAVNAVRAIQGLKPLR